MKKTVILSLALSLTMGAAATTPTTADTVSVTPTSSTSPYTPYTPLRPTYLKGVLVSSPWTTNWFLQASVGTTAFLGTPLGCNDLFGRIRPAFSVALGKWFTPSVGGRITYGGPQFTDCTNSSQHYQYLRADFLWNVLGTQYKEDIHAISRWSLIPFVGLGILHNNDNAHKPLAISYGIQAQYHLSRRLALTAEIGSMTTMQDFDGIGNPHRLGDHLLSASLGLSVHIGKSGWKRAVDARPYIAQNEWLSAYAASLSGTSSNVTSQPPFPKVSLSGPRNDYSGLRSLRARMKSKSTTADPDTAASPRARRFIGESTSGAENYDSPLDDLDEDYLSLIQSGKACIGAPIYFFFHLGTATLLNTSQLVNLDEVARLAKQYGLHVKVIGAADSATGTDSINLPLSRSRADYIARELAQRGVPTGNITATHTGGIDDYTPDEANRHTRLLLFFNSPEHPQ